jgi:hypothetical protein
VATYDVIGDAVMRVAPFAWEPEDFLDEWLDLPWEDVANWSLPHLKPWHERLRSSRMGKERLFISEFSLPVQPYGTNHTQWLIGLVFYPSHTATSLPSWLPDELFVIVGSRDDTYVVERIIHSCDDKISLFTELLEGAVEPDIDLYLQRGACFAAGNNMLAAQKDFDQYITTASEQAGSSSARELATKYFYRGRVYETLERFEDAQRDYEHAITLGGCHNYICQSLAWLLATCPVATIRDGKKAVEYATLLCENSKYRDGDDLDTLAAAYAIANDFSEAVKWEQHAIEHAYDNRRRELFTKRLQLYLSNQPYIQGK